MDLREDGTNVDLRQDYQEPQSCVIDDSPRSAFVDITQRQAKQFGSDEEFVCCKNNDIILYEECPKPTDVYVQTIYYKYITFITF